MNDKPVCEQAHWQVVLAVEPSALAGRKKGMGKSEPADQLFFKFRPLRGVKTLFNRGKAKCEQK